jgi:small subunit ribosomal protein S11e
MVRIAKEYVECDQYEKAYQKQGAIFVARKRAVGGSKAKPMRFVKNVGLGIKTPDAAVEGSYVDKKCPFAGNVSIRGRILKGQVISTKMKRTIIVRRDYLHYIQKYRRYEKRHKNVSAHCSPAFTALKEGDVVTIGQCRPLSKTVRFNVVAHEPQRVKTGKKTFRVF